MKEELEALMQVWNNTEKAQAIQLLKKSMSETSTTNKVNPTVVKTYVKDTIRAGLSHKTLPEYPEDFTLTAKSTYYKEAIREVVKELGEELKITHSENDILKSTWYEVEKAKTLIEFRKFFKLYLVALRTKLYTEDDLKEYAEEIDRLDKEVTQLQEYKRIYNEIFDILEQDDEELNIILKSRKLKDSGLTDTEVSQVLGISRNKLNTLRKKFDIQT